jgi:hypothetical protein
VVPSRTQAQFRAVQQGRLHLNICIGELMKRLGLCTRILAFALFAGSAQAQETDLTGKVSVELNTAQTAGGACTVTFLITNGIGQQIDAAVYETVLFDRDGQVNRLTLFDFGTLPPDRPRVRQFAVPQLSCDHLGQILFNGANACKVAGQDSEICGTGLLPSSRTTIKVLG